MKEQPKPLTLVSMLARKRRGGLLDEQPPETTVYPGSQAGASIAILLSAGTVPVFVVVSLHVKVDDFDVGAARVLLVLVTIASRAPSKKTLLCCLISSLN